MSPEDLDALRGLRQFGPAIPATAAPETLPFDVGRNVVEFGGTRHAAAMAPVRWNDPAGDWTLVTFGDMRLAVSPKQRGIVGLVAALMIMALMELFRRVIHYEAARRDAVARAEAVAGELAAAARQKLQLSEITISLQQARAPEALAQAFFRRLAELVPMQQGTLYFIDSVGTDKSVLTLAGSYGTAAAPARIGVGEGVLGQCARDRRAFLFTEVPAGFWHVSSGLGEALPGTLMVLPLISNQVLLGVLEIASLDARFAADQNLVEALLPVLGMNLEILLAERLSAHNSMAACISSEEEKARRNAAAT